jgi:hypothetical protein
MSLWKEILAAFSGPERQLLAELEKQRAQPPQEAPARVNGKPVVQRDTRPVWMQKRWRQQGNEYHGYFRTRFGSWKGRMYVSPSGRVDLFIHNPPDALHRHPHWACFSALKDGWYSIHHYGIYELSSAIVHIESMLAEAFQKWAQRA